MAGCGWQYALRMRRCGTMRGKTTVVIYCGNQVRPCCFQEVMKAEMDALRSGKKTREQVGDAAVAKNAKN